MAVKKKIQKPAHVSPETKGVGQFQMKNNLRSSNNKVTKVPKAKKTIVVAHEIKFAKLLAGNEKRVRDKVLKNLRKWLTARSQSTYAFTEQDFMRLWKGLYYCMWMSDKPLVQEELAESLSKLVHCFNSVDTSLLYIKCTLVSLSTEWFGIDQYRIDKFQMLVRRIIRQSFVMCKKQSWDGNCVVGFAKIIQDVLLDSKNALGFGLHIIELYLEELAKVSRGKIPEEMIVEFIRPFAIHLAGMDDMSVIRHINKHIFRYLIFQSDIGIDYKEKFEAWRHAGFPTGHIDAMEKVEVDEDEASENGDETDTEDEGKSDEDNESSSEIPLDPRAGRVDVELPQLPFDAQAIADLVMTYRFHPSSTTKSRRQIIRIAKEFTELSKGIMPVGVKEVKLWEGSKAETNPKRAAWRLLQFEKELYADTIRRKRKKKTAKEDDVTPSPKKKVKAADPEESINENESKTTENVSPIGKSLVKKAKKKQINENNTSIEEPSDSQVRIPKAQENNVDGVQKKKKQKHKTKKKINEVNAKTKAQKLLVSAQIATPQSKESNGTPVVINSSNDSIKCKSQKRSSEGQWNVSQNVDPPTPTTPILKQNNDTASKFVVSKTEKTKSDSTTPTLLNITNLPKEIQVKTNPRWSTPMRIKAPIEKAVLRTSKTNRASLPAPLKTSSATSVSPKKTVKIVLQRNTAQHTSEYVRQLRQSPSIPYDANRKPLVGVLKPSPIPSPINPFYKRKF